MRAYKWSIFYALRSADEHVIWYGSNRRQSWHRLATWDPFTTIGVYQDSAGYFNNQIPVLRFMLITGVPL